MNNTSSILVQFEDILKKCILDYFKNILSNDKITLLSEKKYIDKLDFTKLNTRELIQGSILRSILNDIVNVTCIKNLNGQNGIYGEYINSLLIEYYSREIANKYKFSININEKYNDDKNYINLLQNVCKDNFNNYMLNYKIDKILALDGLSELSNYLDCLFNSNYKTEELNNNDINVKNVIVDDNTYFDNEGKITFVSKDGKEFLKYVDNSSREYEFELNDNNVHAYFIDRIHNLADNIELKSNILYLELLDIINNNKKQNNLNNEEVNETINNLDYTTVLDVNEINESIALNSNTVDESNIRKLTPKEYEDLCIKYASGEELSPEQLNLLKQNSPDLLEKIDENNFTKKTSGIINKKMIFIFIGIGILVAGIVLFIILK